MATKKKTTVKKNTTTKNGNVNSNVKKEKDIIEEKNNKVQNSKRLDELSVTELKAAIFDRQEQLAYINKEVEILRSVLAEKLKPSSPVE